MQIKIPAKVLVKCDCCYKECSNDNRCFKGGIVIQKEALDHLGSPVADGSYTWDLCDSCLWAVEKLLNEFQESGWQKAEADQRVNLLSKIN